MALCTPDPKSSSPQLVCRKEGVETFFLTVEGVDRIAVMSGDARVDPPGDDRGRGNRSWTVEEVRRFLEGLAGTA